jgi:hypothetical protein
MQPNTTINICIVKSCFYIASLNNDMFRPLNRPSSGCTYILLFLKQTIQYTMFFVFVNEILCTSIQFVFKITWSSSRVKSYSEIKDINNIKMGVWSRGGGGGGYGAKLGIFLFDNTGNTGNAWKFVLQGLGFSDGKKIFLAVLSRSRHEDCTILIVVFPCMLTIIQLLFQLNAHVLYY